MISKSEFICFALSIVRQLLEEVEKLEARNAQLIDEANKSMLHAHDHMNRCVKLEAVRKAAEELTGCCIHACEPKTLDKLGELKQALEGAE